MKHLISVCAFGAVLALLLMPGLTLRASAAIPYKVPLAYIGEDGNVYVTEVGAGVGTRLTRDARMPTPLERFYLCDPCPNEDAFHPYANIHWSPDGSQFAFVEYYSGQVYLAESGKPPRLLNPDVRATVNRGTDMMTWSPDSTKLAVAAGGIEVLSVADGSVTSTPIKLAGWYVGDGPGVSDWIDADAYSAEIGWISSNMAPLRIYWTRYGLLYQTSILRMVDFEGKTLWSYGGDNFQDLIEEDSNKEVITYSTVVPMPDGKTAYAIESHTLRGNTTHSVPVQIELVTGNTTPLDKFAANKYLEDVVVTPDGNTFVYTRSKSGGIIKAEPNSVIGKTLFREHWPYDGPSYAVSMWRQPLVGGSPIPIFTKGGNGIAIISPSPDSSGVAFSLVTASSEMVRKLNAERPKDEVLAAFPHAELYYVNLLDGRPQFITRGGQPAFGKGPFVAVPAE